MLSLGETTLGNPVCVTRKIGNSNTDLNLDYMLSAIEMDFLESALQHDSTAVKRVVEVGAGFGRTAHMVLTHLQDIENYTILDFSEMVELSRSYLKSVLPLQLFNKILFITTMEELDSNFDLAIQIDGLQEMEEVVIESYYECVFTKSRFVFLRNPVAKYLPSKGGILNTESVEIPLSLGRSQRVIDIWNVSEVGDVCAQHDVAYTPNNGTLVKAQNCRLFPHYRMQFFVNDLRN